MIKIEYLHKRKMESRHLDYFKTRITPNFDEYLIEYTEVNSYIMLPIKREKFKTKFVKENKKFFKFIKHNWRKIAIGNVHMLRDLENIIRKNYPTVIEVLEADLKLTNAALKNNPKLKRSYREYIFSLFGYTEFKTKTLYDYIKSMAIDNLGLEQYEKDADVYKEIYQILKWNFPMHINDINTYFPDENNVSEKDCKQRFEELYNLDFTLMHFNEFLKNDKRDFNFNGEWNPYQLVLFSGIRVCPYCNKHYVTPIFSQRGRMRADLDHFLPKSKYPYFSMSLYNLVPSCKTCNQSAKKALDFTFDFINPFSNNIDDYFEFKANIVTNEIETNILKDELNIQEYLNVFKVKSTYNYHQNQIKEILDKRLAYTEEYIEQLYSEIPYKPENIELFKQLIIGYVKDVDDIGQEAFAKLRRDVARQVGFIGSANPDLINKLKKLRTR